MTVLPLAAWQEREAVHAAAVDTLTAGHRARRVAGIKHPVEDFLFEYYNHPPARFRRWHPGSGVVLEGGAGMPRAAWTHYRAVGDGLVLDRETFLAARGRTVGFVRDLLAATLARPAAYGCFALHEWAMVDGLGQEEVRHRAWPLRATPAEVSSLVRSLPIRCSHYDAYRFFTPSALPLNELRPTRETQVEHEQPGCLHAGMDLYKWCFKLAPAIPSDLTLAAYRLALEIRTLDMAASPYDVRDLGVSPIHLRTPAGRAEFATQQRAFAERANALRREILAALEALG